MSIRLDNGRWLHAEYCVAVCIVKFVKDSNGDEIPHVLLGKRKGSRFAGQWAPVGGLIEKEEDAHLAAIRETKEEVDIDIKLEVLYRDRDISFYDETPGDSYNYCVTMFITVVPEGTQPKLVEPDKCQEWKWFNIYELPSPVILSFHAFSSTLISIVSNPKWAREQKQKLQL